MRFALLILILEFGFVAEVLPGNGGGPEKNSERFVVTLMRGPSLCTLYQQNYCARGQVENWIRQLKRDWKADQTSPSSFTANFGRLLYMGTAHVLYQQLR